MMNGIRMEYANTQAMMRQKNQMNAVGTAGVEESEKKQRKLEEERKSIQNSLLLMKTTSGDSVGSEESIKILERKLEEIDSRIKAEEKENPEVSAEEKKTTQEDGGFRIKNNFDVYETYKKSYK